MTVELKEKINPYVFVSITEWNKQKDKGNTYETATEKFITSWNPKTCSNFAQTVKIHSFLRMPYMKPKTSNVQ
tara:strand:- start:438 stop:656 length:219 start_codon:yes stop_codon:yes gene_type:complete